jgi:hypothetical protein
MGHVMKDCPSRHAFIAVPDGNGYVSASDIEDDLALADSEDDKSEAIDSLAASADFSSLLVWHVLSSKAEHENEEKLQRKNLYHIFLIIKGCRILTIINSKNCSNLVRLDLVKKFGLATRSLPHPYHLEWLNNSGNVKVTKIQFSVGSYHDYADFDVVPMQASSLLLGRPWEFDNDASHHDRTNTYSFMYKDKKITFLLLSPADIRKYNKEFAENAKNNPPSDDSTDVQYNGIKLKGGAFIATISAAAELCDHPDAPCYTMLCEICVLFPIIRYLALCILLSLTFCKSLMMGLSRG